MLRCPRLLQLRSYATSSRKPNQKPRVLVLGTGWGGNKVARGLDKSKFDVRVVSPANHFLFTSFLPSTAVGTLEFRAIQEPIRTVKGLKYYQAKAIRIEGPDSAACSAEGDDYEASDEYQQRWPRRIVCQDIFKGTKFSIGYDYLVLAPGCKTNTFGTPGVMEREGKEVFFLKHLYHARQIRNRALECFERASNPTLTPAEVDRLLSFVVVGGGPTSCEFATELHDFLRYDVARWYPDLAPRVKIALVEAGPSILGSFDAALAMYYRKALEKKDVSVLTGTGVTEVEEQNIDGNHSTVAHMSNGETIPFGMMVWSAGLAPIRFIDNCGLPQHERGGRLTVDPTLRVTGHDRLFSLGDCAADSEAPLPPIASVAEQQGQYLSDCFNEHYASFDPCSDSLLPPPGIVAAPVGLPFPRFMFSKSANFRYINVGSMASMGTDGGVVDMTKADVTGGKGNGGTVSGFLAMVMWRGGYLSKQLSWQNMMLVPMFWFKSWVFGRDISRF